MIRFLDNHSLGVIFESTSPMRVDIKSEKKATKFAVETGAIRSDHVIDLLTEISVDLMLTGDNAAEAYWRIKEYFDARKLVSVQCEMGTYADMLIEAMPHTESAANLGGAAMPMRLIEWREVRPDYGSLQQEKVKNPEHAGTQKLGKQTGATPSEPQKEKSSSILYRLAN